MGLNGESRLVLVVEDERLLRTFIADEFRYAGWQVVEADAAEEAIKLMRDGRPIDIVFTDIQLAGQLSGWDIGEQCRNLREDVAIIYASGNAKDLSRRVDGSLFFDKPYMVEDVIEACRSLT